MPKNEDGKRALARFAAARSLSVSKTGAIIVAIIVIAILVANSSRVGPADSTIAAAVNMTPVENQQAGYSDGFTAATVVAVIAAGIGVVAANLLSKALRWRLVSAVEFAEFRRTATLSAWALLVTDGAYYVIQTFRRSSLDVNLAVEIGVATVTIAVTWSLSARARKRHA